MARASKEKELLELFYNYPTKQWHFSQIKEKVKLPDYAISRWLKKFQEQKLVVKHALKGKMPYYIGNHEKSKYQISKQLYGLQKLNDTGFLEHVHDLPRAKIVILFGSIIRSDWWCASDIDIFIYGNADEFERHKFEVLLGREIQVFEVKDLQELRKFSKNLLKNIIKGYVLKGHITYLEEAI